MIYTAIAICEVAFWGFLVAGLATRYLLHRRRASVVLLLGSPAVDLMLLALVAVDLQRGAPATPAHALAALYLGVSVAFGRSAVHWADRWFARRFAGGLPVARPDRSGRQQAAHEWRTFRKAALAWTVASALLLLMSALVGDLDRAQPLLGYAGMLTIGLAVWLIIGPVRASLAVHRVPLRGRRQAIEPTADTGPPPGLRGAGGGTGSEPPSRPAAPAPPWAPWWVYLGVILGVNYLRQVLMPAGTVPEWTVVLIVLGMSTALFVTSTVIYRATGRR